jgi:hypothetical protein
MLARSKNFVASAGTWAVAIAIGIALSGCATTGNRQDASDGTGWAIAKGAGRGAAAAAYVGTLCGPLFLLCAPPLALAGAVVGAAAGAGSSSRSHANVNPGPDPRIDYGNSEFMRNPWYGYPEPGAEITKEEIASMNRGLWRSPWHEEIDVPVGRTNGVADEFAGGEIHVLQLHAVPATTDLPRPAFLRLLPDSGGSDLLKARAYCDTGVLDVRVSRLPPKEDSPDYEFHTKQSDGQVTEPVWGKAVEVICSATE